MHHVDRLLVYAHERYGPARTRDVRARKVPVVAFDPRALSVSGGGT